MKKIQRLIATCLVLAAAAALTLLDVRQAIAHGERSQEPYLRTRATQWFDVDWTKRSVGVNEEVEITGKFYLMEDWPDSIAKPDLVFVSMVSPGPVFARTESFLNGKPARQSFMNLELGKVYDYRMVLRGRVPGRWHVHPMISVHQVGPLVGPGEWIEVTGSADDFVLPLETIGGQQIEDLQTFNVMNVVGWHIVWIVIAAAWLLFWLLRPLLVPRWIVLQQGREDLLIRRTDVIVGASVVVVALLLGAYSYISATAENPRVVPLQVGKSKHVAIEQPPKDIAIDLKRATYDVPGRAMRMVFDATNEGDQPLTLGEFTTASLRFVNMASPEAVARVSPDFPSELVPSAGLEINDASPLLPGETRTFEVNAIDAAWELERLTSFMTDVDSRFGGLLFFYDSEGTRHLAEVAGPIIPVFTDDDEPDAATKISLDTRSAGN